MQPAQFKSIFYWLLLLLLVSTIGCQPTTDSQSQHSPTRSDTQLVLNEAVLEQSNRQDGTIWKIGADSIVYSEDRQTATLNNVVGNLRQNGKIIFQIKAKTGEVRDNGNLILLKEDIVASDPRNNSAIYSGAMEWRPQENLLSIPEKLNGVRDDLKITANSGKYYTDRERLEIEGNVVATTTQPALQLKSDRLLWYIPNNSLESPGAVEIVRYDTDYTVTDRLVGDRADVDLDSDTATLKDNIELITLKPQLQVATNFFTWNYRERLGKTDRPIQILDRQRQISLTGNAGEIDFSQQIAKLQNGVKGINQPRGSQIYARQLNWNIDTERVEATGNIIYEQTDPQARLTGDKAVGTLNNNQIVVTSDGKQQVTTVIENRIEPN